GVLSRCEPHRSLASVPLGRIEFRLFAPAALLPANPRLKVKSDILANLHLATLEGSPGIRQAIEQEAQRIGIKLNMRLRFSSYPQLAQAVQTLGVAARVLGWRGGETQGRSEHRSLCASAAG